jgi:hypothetical protein
MSVNAIRICLGAASGCEILKTGLGILSDMLKGSPGHSAATV